MFENVIKIPI